MNDLQFYKVMSLPEKLVPNAIYLVAQENSNILQIFVANKTGDGVLESINETHIRSMIKNELISTPKNHRFYPYLLATVLALVIAFLIFLLWPSHKIPGYAVQAYTSPTIITAPGHIGAVSTIQADAAINSIVQQHRVEVGDQVSTGDVLVDIKSDQIETQIKELQLELTRLNQIHTNLAKTEVTKTKLQEQQAQSEYIRRLNLGSAISREQVEIARTAHKIAKSNHDASVLKHRELEFEKNKLKSKIDALNSQNKIYSTFTGTILTRHIQPGDVIHPSKTLFTIATDDSNEIKVFLDKTKIQSIQLNQTATVTPHDHPQKVLQAKVTSIGQLNPQTQLAEVRLQLDETQDKTFLNQEIGVYVRIETDKQNRALLLPNDTLLNVQENQANVMVVRDGRVHHQIITLGQRGVSASEVLLGLKEHDQVLVNVVKPLQDGDKVRVGLQHYSTQLD